MATSRYLDDPLPGFRWPVAAAATIAAPASRLWEIVSAPGNLELCHPFCAANPVMAWPGASSRDEVRYLNGLTLERRFQRWFDGVGYDLEIGRPGGKTSFVSWRILPRDADAAVLRITVYPHHLQRLPLAIRWVPYWLSMRPRLAAYLSSVVGGFAWYATRGEPVPRNHFGPHPWFSATVGRKADGPAAD